MQIKKRIFDTEKLESKANSFTFDDKYCAISIRQLQTAFCLFDVGICIGSCLFCD
jgi:hypothetical protein